MADRYLVAGGNGQWNSTSNWSATSGGAAGASIPVGTDAVIFNAASANANITVDVASICLSITASSYTGTLTVNSTLTCSSGFTFSTGMICAGTGTIFVTGATSSIVSNGVSFPGTLRVLSSVTINNTGTLTVGALECAFSSGTFTLNGGTLNTNSLISTTITSGIISGTTKIVLTGTGTVSFPVGWSGSIANNIDINSTNTTFVNNFRYITGTINYIAGTVDASAGTLVLAGSSCTLNTAGMSWGNVSFGTVSTTPTITLASNLNINGTLFTLVSNLTITFSGSFVVNTGTLNIQGTTTTLVLNGGTINTNSLVSTTVTSKIISGTTKIVLTGTGTVSFPVTWTGHIANSIDINSTNTTFIGNFGYITGTFRYIAGTVDASASTLILRGACTINTSGMDWGNVTVGVALTLILTSAFTCSGTFSIPAVVFTVSGAGFWTRVGNLTFTGNTTTLNLPNNLTVTGTLTPGTSTTTINGNSLLISSLSARGTLTGTATIVFNGTGTWSGTGILTNNTTINTTGTLTVGNGVDPIKFSTRTLTYTAGTVDSSIGGLQCTAACTLNCSGMTWAKILLTGAITLASNLNATHTRITGTTSFVNANRFTQTSILSIQGTSSLTLLNNVTVTDTFESINTGGAQTINGFQLICNGDITTTGTGNTAGTTTILLNGTGTWTAPLITDTNAIRNNTVINTTGTITFAGYPQFNTGTLTYTAGTVVTAGSELRCWTTTTLNTAGISWDTVSFAGSITLSSNLTVTGTTKIVAGTAFVGLNRFTQVPVLELIGPATLTLINNITVTNTFKSLNNGSAQTMDGFQVICNGGITTTGTGSLSGTTTILLNGTGTWASDATIDAIDVESNMAAIRNNVTINTTGTVTFSGVCSFNAGTLTYIAGTVVTSGSLLNCWGATTLDTAGISWDNVQINGTITLTSTLTVTGTTTTRGTTRFTPAGRFTQTGNLQMYSATVLTLLNNITVTGNLSTLDSAANHIINGFQVSVVGNLSLSQISNTTLGGTASIVLTGTGTWSGSATLSNNLSINTTGSITVSGTVLYSTGTLTYVAGTVNTADATLNIKGSSTLNTQGMQWKVLIIDTAATITLPSQLYINDNIYLDSTNIAFAGPGGFNCHGILQRVQGTITLESGRTFTIRNFFESKSGSNTSTSLFQSATPGSQAIMTLLPEATQILGYVNATDIDSSLGQKIWSFSAILTNATNWQDLSLIVADLNAGTGTTSAETAHTWVA